MGSLEADVRVFCPTVGERPTIAHTLFPDDFPFAFIVDQHTDPRPLRESTGKNVIQVQIFDDRRCTRLAEIRNAIEARVDLGEWFIEVDDDIRGITMLDPVMYRGSGDDIDYEDWSAKEWHDWFRHRATPEEVRFIFADLVAECENVGTIYGGCSFFDNPFYRKKKFAYASYVNGGLHVKRKDGRAWRWTPHEDMEMSCYALRTYGASVVNRWAHGLFKDSTEGGGGTFSDDWKKWIAVRIEQMFREYPGLLKRDGDYRLKITKNSLKSVENWRRVNGFL